MDAFEAIYGRRSIRRYTDQPVSEGIIEELLKAAMAAPSANNGQPWHFVVMDDRAILDAVPKWHPYASMVKYAPLAIAVCADTRGGKSEAYWVQDCSAATQNLLLAAHAKGLGAVWLGIYPEEERVKDAQKLLALPEDVIPLAIVALGHPAAQKPPNDRFDAGRVHRNRWD
ncbi:hypothetical protein LCGC14_1479630 [marine sediment metagenome]|uniref:Nitroreductase domain-containing protein n=1 Tax=marine sediment metagenome TaxID=412755 RepID=A0A0F9JVU8_9ZZZZ